MKSKLSTFILNQMGSQFMLMLSGILMWGVLLAYFPTRETLCSAVAVAALALNMWGQYAGAWRIGERDRNLVKYGHITYRPYRGFIVGAVSLLPSLAGLIILELTAHRYMYVVYIIGVALTPLLTGIGYLNGHKLKSLGISIVYRKKR